MHQPFTPRVIHYFIILYFCLYVRVVAPSLRHNATPTSTLYWHYTVLSFQSHVKVKIMLYAIYMLYICYMYAIYMLYMFYIYAIYIHIYLYIHIMGIDKVHKVCMNGWSQWIHIKIYMWIMFSLCHSWYLNFHCTFHNFSRT